MAKRWLRNDLPVLGLYLALTLGLTYPLIANFSTHVPGTNVDEYTFLWNIWWFKHALFDSGIDPFTTTATFYPLGASLAFYTLAILNDVAALPLAAAFGIVTASNLVLVFSFALSGYGAYLLVRYLLDEVGITGGAGAAAAFLGGVVYAFPASRFIYASLGHYNIVSAEWIPFYALFFLKMLREPRLEGAEAPPGGAWRLSPASRNAMFAGFCLCAALLTELTYGLFLLLLSILWLAFTPRGLVISRAFLRRAAMLVAAAVVPFSPVLYFLIQELRQGQTANFPGWGYADLLSADLVGLFTPTRLHPLWGQAVADRLTQFTDVNTLFIGYGVTLLALIAVVVYRRRLVVWITGAVSFVILALGPVLHINGQYLFDLDGLTVTVPLPYAIFHYLPLFNMNRVPNRFSVPLSLCLAVLVGFAAVWLLRRFRGRVWTTAVFVAALALVTLDGLSVPLPLTDARVPSVYARIAAEPGDFAILPLPLGWRESFRTMGAEQTQIQYYQVVHGKRLLNGNASRIPDFKLAYYDHIPLLKSIVDEEMYRPVDEARRQSDRAAAAEIAYFFDLRYVVFNPATPGRLPYADTITRTQEYVRQVLPLELAFAQDGVTAYRVAQQPVKTDLLVDFGAPGARLYQGEGWGDDEAGAGGLTFNWATRKSARFFMPLREMGDYRLTLAALPFAYPGGPRQTITVRVNGSALPDRLTLDSAWAQYDMTVAARDLRPGLNEFVLEFGYAVSPREALPAEFGIGGTGVRSPVEMTVQSGSGFASIKIGETEAAPVGAALAVVVLDESSGRQIASRSFDIGADGAQSQALVDFLAGLSAGRIVAVAARPDARRDASPAATAALGSLGVATPSGAQSGQALAAIGVKGASPGQALEHWLGGVAYVHVGPNADGRTLAAAIDSVRLTKVSP
jgi:hypothetical protein